MRALSISTGLKLGLLMAVLAVLATTQPARPALANFGYVAVSASDTHTCGLTSAGGVRCWGDNLYGQLGDGTAGNENRQPTPGDVVGLTSGVEAIATGYSYSCALLQTGSVKCWGQNAVGQLGDGTFIDRASPVDVVGLAGTATAIAAGSGAHTCALLADTTAQCWGNNYLGQLGNGTASNEDPPNVGNPVPGLVCADASCSAPLSGVVQIVPGYGDTCALVEDDALTPGYGVKCWGGLWVGEAVGAGDPLYCGNQYGSYCETTPKDLIGLASGFTAIAMGPSHRCVITSAGGAQCWGLNNLGQLGSGSTNFIESSLQSVVGLSSGVVKIAAGLDKSCAITDTGALKCWGNPYLGDGSLVPQNTPVDVCADAACSGPFSDAIDVSIDTYYHSCAVNADGYVKCWGFNFYGQVGTGSIDPYPDAVPLPADLRQDTDGDGCIDLSEVQTAPGSQFEGGLRNPKDPWDYFDPTDDGMVRMVDIMMVVMHYGSSTGDPGYDTRYDRTYAGPYPWSLGPPDGNISIADIMAVIRQFAHDCV